MKEARRNSRHDVRRERLFQKEGVSTDIVYHYAGGFASNALSVILPGPRRALSSREGLKTLTHACNCYLPAEVQETLDNRQPAWRLYFKEVTAACFGKEVPVRSRTVLSTGVDIKHVVWREESIGEQWVITVVTAGVKTNALRIGVDRAMVIERSGKFEPAGTINIIILTNVRLTAAALAASLVTATEAKVVALQDLDIRSIYTPEYQASGTGTDQVLVIAGDGSRCNYAGGHTALGEIMGRAVTAAVTGAIRETHGI